MNDSIISQLLKDEFCNINSFDILELSVILNSLIFKHENLDSSEIVNHRILNLNDLDLLLTSTIDKTRNYLNSPNLKISKMKIAKQVFFKAVSEAVVEITLEENGQEAKIYYEKFTEKLKSELNLKQTKRQTKAKNKT